MPDFDAIEAAGWQVEWLPEGLRRKEKRSRRHEEHAHV